MTNLKKRLIPLSFLCWLVAIRSFGQSPNETNGCSATDCTGKIEAIKMSEHPNGSLNGRNTVFILSHIPLLELPVSASRNGIALNLGRDFRVMRDQLILTIPPNSGDSLAISFYSLPTLRNVTRSRRLSAQTPGSDSLVTNFAESAAQKAVFAELEDLDRLDGTRVDQPGTLPDQDSKGVTLLLERTESHLSSTARTNSNRASTTGFEGLGDMPFRALKTAKNDSVVSENDKLVELLKNAINSNTPLRDHH